MTTAEQGAPATAIERARLLLFRPRAGWADIAAGPEPVRRLFTAYALPLAAIGPVASLVASQVWGRESFLGMLRPPILTAVVTAVVAYAAALASVCLLALLLDAVAPVVGGRRDRRRAFNLAIFAAIPAWLAQVFLLVPALAPLSLLGLYSLYLLYVGAPGLMRVSGGRGLAFSAVALIAAMGVWAVTMTVGAAVIGAAGLPVA